MQGIIGALTSDGTVDHAINLELGEPIEMRKIVRVNEVALDKGIDRRPVWPENLPISFASLKSAKTLLGKQPKVPIQSGLQRSTMGTESGKLES